MSDIATVMKACEAIEAQLTKFADKTDAELRNARIYLGRYQGSSRRPVGKTARNR